MLKMALHSASHRTLLEIIQDKESELSHIRKAASVAAQEETRGIETQLFELKQDCSHHVKLLHDKDDVIQRLQDQLLQTEGENLRNIESIQRNCEELASIQITKETAKVEDEMRRRLQREYEDKLSRSKEDLEREYQSALVNQIQDQESLLYGIFDREIADREKEHTKQMNDIQRDMGIKDKERLELLYSSEQNYKKREASMLDEAKMRFESEARMKLEESECQWKAQMRSVEEEIEQDEKEMNRIGQDRSQLEVDNRELKYKIEELLSLIQQLQGEIGDNCEDFEIHKNKFKIGVKEWEDKCTLLDTLLKDEEENHRRQLHKVEKNSKSDRKALNRVMNKLKKDIVALKDEKDVAEELVKEKKDEMCTSRHQLKDKVASLRKDCHGLRMEIDSMHSKSLIDTRSKTRHKEDFALALEKKENAEQSIRRQIHFEHEAELERSTKQHMQKKLALVRERDDAIFDKDRLETKNREKDEEYGAMQSEVLIVQNRLRNDLRVMSTNNRNTQEQNSKLKETIKTMRKELETSMSSLMEEREQCITCSQRDPQKKEINLQTYEDRTSRYVPQNRETATKTYCSQRFFDIRIIVGTTL